MRRYGWNAVWAFGFCAGCQVVSELPAEREPFEQPPSEGDPPMGTPYDARPLLKGSLPATPPSFEVTRLVPQARKPVVAVRADGTTAWAYVDQEAEAPVVVGHGAVPLELPTPQRLTSALSMIASMDGALHVVWEASSTLYYVRVGANDSIGEIVMVAPFPARDPTLALSSIGDLIVAYTSDVPEVDGVRSPARVLVTKGAHDGARMTFAAPVHTNPGCCVADFDGEVAQNVSGPTLALGPDDSIHVVYEWGSWSQVTLDYVNDRDGDGGFSVPVRVSNAAFVPCPSLSIDEEGRAHIVYLTQNEPSVWYAQVADGVLSDPEAIYQGLAQPTMAMMERDRDGLLHTAITERSPRGTRLLYVRARGFVAESAIVMHEVPDAFLEMTGARGGSVLAPSGALLFAYERSPSSAEPRGAEIIATLP